MFILLSLFVSFAYADNKVLADFDGEINGMPITVRYFKYGIINTPTGETITKCDLKRSYWQRSWDLLDATGGAWVNDGIIKNRTDCFFRESTVTYRYEPVNIRKETVYHPHLEGQLLDKNIAIPGPQVQKIKEQIALIKNNINALGKISKIELVFLDTSEISKLTVLPDLPSTGKDVHQHIFHFTQDMIPESYFKDLYYCR